MMPQILNDIVEGKTLSVTEAAELMRMMLDADSDDCVIAGVLSALRTRGETADELAGFVQALLEIAQPVAPLETAGKLGPSVDTCGTGGDSSGTFNISTATSLLCGAAGLDVVKHGNRSVTSSCGSADVIETLGIDFTKPDESQTVSEGLAGAFRFFFAPHFHPAVARVVPIRRALKIRTAFNLIGPLANPANPDYQLIGVARQDLMQRVAEAASKLGRKRVFVVHGEPGCDEATPAGAIHILDVQGEEITERTMTAADFGIAQCTLADLAGDDAKSNAKLIEDIFAGNADEAKIDTVVLNTALVFMLAGVKSDPREAAKFAYETIYFGRASAFLKSLQGVSCEV